MGHSGFHLPSGLGEKRCCAQGRGKAQAKEAEGPRAPQLSPLEFLLAFVETARFL